MKLWLISQSVNTGYDSYDSAVVRASTEEEARKIRPGSCYRSEKESPFMDEDDWKSGCFGSWATRPNQVVVEFLGTSRPDAPVGVVLASFNAG